MSSESFALAGLRAAIAATGVEFTIGADTYSAVQSDDIQTMPLQDGGFLTDYAFTLHCAKEDFDSLPAIGSTLDLDSVSYRILRVTTSAGDPGVALDVGTINK